MKCSINDAEGKTLKKNVYSNITEEILYHKNNVLSKSEIEVLKNHDIKEVEVLKGEDVSSFSDAIDDSIYEFLKTINFDLLDDIVSLYEESISQNEVLKNDMTIYVKTTRDEITPKLLTVLNTNFAVTIANAYNKSHSKKECIDISELIKTSIIQDIGLVCSANKLYLDNLSSKFDEDIKLLKDKYESINGECLSYYDISMHPVYSYYMAKNANLSNSICNSVLLHEELYERNEEAQNTPLNTSLKEENNVIATIIKVADSYNRLLFALVQQNKENPFISITKHLDKLVANGTLSPEIVKLLKYVIPVYQLDSKVLLSDGTIARVCELNPNDISSPRLIDLNGEYINDKEISISYPL